MTKDELDKIKILNLLMWLQACVYASDECENIGWFYNRQTKQLLKRLIDVIQKEHGPVINTLWDTEGVTMPNITQHLDEFTKEMASTGYWMLPDIIQLIKAVRHEESQKEIDSSTEDPI